MSSFSYINWIATMPCSNSSISMILCLLPVPLLNRTATFLSSTWSPTGHYPEYTVLTSASFSPSSGTSSHWQYIEVYQILTQGPPNWSAEERGTGCSENTSWTKNTSNGNYLYLTCPTSTCSFLGAAFLWQAKTTSVKLSITLRGSRVRWGVLERTWVLKSGALCVCAWYLIRYLL